MITNILDRKLLLSATAFSALSLTACAEPAATDADDAPEQTETLAQQAPVNVPNPEGSYFADVVANGSGCPQGTWGVDISSDGQVFTATFSKYETEIAPETVDPLTQSECTLSVQLHSPQGLSYAITSFSYSGYAFLEEGVVARQSARYWFQGSPIPPATSNRTDLTGPYDKSFLFNDDLKIQDQVYSPCGTTRDLNVNTRLQLVNSSPKRSGYANVASIDGRTELKFGLAWKKCNAGSTSGSTSGSQPSSGSTGSTGSSSNGDVTSTTGGNTGSTGSTGNTGSTGSTGSSNSGNTGSTGSNSSNSGNTGNTGSNSGNTGSTGSTGNTGNTRPGSGPTIGGSGPSIGGVTRGGTIGGVTRTSR